MRNPSLEETTKKAQLRSQYLSLRAKTKKEDKTLWDSQIFRQLINTKEYKQASLILCFVSTPDEINTHSFIKDAINQGKTVGVPYCTSQLGVMNFYKITSLEGLTRSKFGILEPNPNTSEEIEDFSQGLCVTPGLVFDKKGCRIGYGGGFYDTFFATKGKELFSKIGICYSQAFTNSVICGKFDIPCDYVVTEKAIHKSVV